ncbi:MAG TPA: amino acid adenylation domain-containing protein, partial [Blastocatellia bacterium]
MVQKRRAIQPETALCIHQLFESQVERTPEAAALIASGCQLTYAELNSRANRLAHYLIGIGVSPEVNVGIEMERGVDVVVSILAVLKSGAAYVPLDPSHPHDRLSFMMQDATISVLLTLERLIEQLPGSMSFPIAVDAAAAEIASQPDDNPSIAIDASNTAYIIYTSGSTGTPKGVAVEHRNVCNTALAAVKGWGLRQTDRVLQLYSLSFDASVLDLFIAILTGAVVYIAGENVRFAGMELVETLIDEAITIAKLPPALLAYLPSDDLPVLREIICGGEAVPLGVASRWARNRDFFCVYGPTEATIASTWYKVDLAKLPPESSNVPIGSPLSNTSANILDQGLQLCASESPGQLFISGAGLARGYINSPELTADRFIPNPNCSAVGARMYKTGDLTRYIADGCLEFLGRTDNQVKIRGFRIEIGEIESAINEHPSVQNGVVIAREDSLGEKRLVAYLILEDPSSSIAQLRGALANRLPEYMIPADFVVLDKFPVTPTGKVDRRELPAPERTRSNMESQYMAPQNQLQQALVGLWEQVLAVKRIGVLDNFFDLGGNSLQAAEFMNRLQEKGGQFVHIVTLFDNPTIAQLAAYLEKEHPVTISDIYGSEAASSPRTKAAARPEYTVLDEAKVQLMRGLIEVLPPLPAKSSAKAAKNPQAIFVLSPPRSGSTLFRVMLAGHPSLFAPPELQLLCFNTLTDRKAAFSGRYTFWLEGAIRAVMELRGCDGAEAREIVEAFEAQDMPVSEFYRLIQEWAAEKILVDKTPGYALDIEVLKRAEEYFENPLYIHLIRHPYGMINSFEDAKLEQIFKYKHSFAPRELGELMWLVSHQNILQFLGQIPTERCHSVKFEELVDAPRGVIERVCHFLGIDYDPGMLRPHDGARSKMTDGIHGLSRMLGDIRFHEHKRVERGVADRWRERYKTDFLGETTWGVAESFGYDGPRNGGGVGPASASESSPSLRLRQRGADLPLSYIQQRVWFMDQLDPGTPAYQVRAGAHASGPLNICALEQTANLILARHELLRTKFVSKDGMPI